MRSPDLVAAGGARHGQTHRLSGRIAQTGQGRALVDLHAELEQHAPQAAGQERRLHRGTVAHVGAAAEARRAAASPHLLGGERHELFGRADRGRRAATEASGRASWAGAVETTSIPAWR